MIELRFFVPDDVTHFSSVKIKCLTVYAQFNGNDAYQIGMKYLRIVEGDEALNRYLLFRASTD